MKQIQQYQTNIEAIEEDDNEEVNHNEMDDEDNTVVE